MPFTPRHVIKTAVQRRRAHFNRYGCTAKVFLASGVLAVENFYGTDGRKVRADAVAWACETAEDFARSLGTTWHSPRDSRNPYMA